MTDITTRPIAFFIRQLAGGGAQKIMIKIANSVANAGYPVEIITLQGGGTFSALVDPRVTVTELKASRLLTSPLALAAHLRARPPRALVATEVAVNIIAIIGALLSRRRKQTRIVIREAMYPSIAMRDDPYRATRIGYRLARFFYPRADAIIAIARGMVDDLARLAHIPASRITAIPFNPCVDARLLAAGNNPPPHSWLAADRPMPCLVAVGRLSGQKDFATLIRAFAILRATRPARLLIVGEGENRVLLQGLIDQHDLNDNLQLLGHRANPYDYMVHADVFVMTSRTEGLGNVLIEALALGAPCVATDCPVGPRETLADGAYGTLVPVGDAQAIADAVATTLDHPPNRDRLRARGALYTAEHSLKYYLPVILGEPDAA